MRTTSLAEPGRAASWMPLQVAASLLGAAFERKQIAQERAESERFWSLMFRLSAAGLEAIDEEALLSSTVDPLANVIHADHCLIMLWDDAQEQVATSAGTGRIASVLSSYSGPVPSRSIMGTLLQEPRTLVFDDLEKYTDAYAEVVSHVSLVSGIAVPLIARNRVMGAVLLGFATAHTVTAVERERVELATQQLARFLSNFRLLKAETTARKQAETLQAVGQLLSSTLDLREVLERVLSELQQVVPYDSASVQRLEGNRSVIVAVQGFDDAFPRVGLAFDVDDPDLPNRIVYRERQPAIVADVMTSHGGFGAAADGSDYIHSWLGVPLIFGDEVIGMLTLDKTEPEFYNEQHASLAGAFASQAAIALENARLFDVTRQLNIRVWRQAEQLGQVMDAVTDAIVLLDAQNGVVLGNTAFYEYLPTLTGRSRATTLDTICGQPLEYFLEPDGGVGWREVAVSGGARRIFAVSANRVSALDRIKAAWCCRSPMSQPSASSVRRGAQERLATIARLPAASPTTSTTSCRIIGFADLLSKNPDIPQSARHRLALMAAEGQRS
ncbi:MAG: GAF domain-containing protein [Caldilineales bacterium]